MICGIGLGCILQLLSESLDVILDQDWTASLGNAFAKQYELYVGDNQHSALLHRCALITEKQTRDALIF
jgi:hypothetical protein